MRPIIFQKLVFHAFYYRANILLNHFVTSSGEAYLINTAVDKAGLFPEGVESVFKGDGTRTEPESGLFCAPIAFTKTHI